MTITYGSARDLFEAARSAARECERERRELARLENAEGASGNSMSERVTAPMSDPLTRTDARIDHETRVRLAIEEDERLMDYATSVLYGADQRGRFGGLYSFGDIGGSAGQTGRVASDVMWWFYLAPSTWWITSHSVSASESWCRSTRDAAMRFIDSVGFDAVIAGADAS